MRTDQQKADSTTLTQGLDQQFGTVVKVMIFKRRPFLQAFVEFLKRSEAEEAIQFIHGCKINNFGVFKVYLSQKDQLSVDNQFLEVK